MNEPALFDTASGTKARFTTAEFLRMSETGAFDDMKVELVDGELERMNPPMSSHGAMQANIMIALWNAIQGTDARLSGEVGIDLGNDTLVGCDVALVRQKIESNRMLSAGDILLVIEVAQTILARDMGLKRVKYAGVAIEHYWVIDAERSVIHVYGEPIDGDYAQISSVRFGEPLAVPGTDRSITID